MGSCREEVLVSKPLRPPFPALLWRKQRNKASGMGNAFSCSSSSSTGKKLVCVTSGNSHLGSSLAKKLLSRGYLVRVAIQNQGDFEGVKDQMTEAEMNQLESVVIAKMGDLNGLCAAFRGCSAVFHTSSFVDPRGISGYSERMTLVEAEGAKNVIEACGRASYGKRCIFTSSLLASIWREYPTDDDGALVDESCWSDEEFCRRNKLWLALGKTRAERAAWRMAKDLKVNLVTLCPALPMAPSFQFPTDDAHDHYKSASIPYLKGGGKMLEQGVLATADVRNIVDAHVHVYEAMDYGACGRYFCFDKIVRSSREAMEIENALKLNGLILSAGESGGDPSEVRMRSRLTAASKLAKLVAARRVSCTGYIHHF